MEEVVRTNQIEGAWKHAKDNFHRMSGLKVRQFEGHLSRIMRRSEYKGNLCDGFFKSFKSTSTLKSSPPRLWRSELERTPASGRLDVRIRAATDLSRKNR